MLKEFLEKHSLTIVLMIPLIIMLSIIVNLLMNENNADKFCAQKGFAEGEASKNHMSGYPIKCFNVCFSENTGEYDCNTKYFLEE